LAACSPTEPAPTPTSRVAAANTPTQLPRRHQLLAFAENREQHLRPIPGNQRPLLHPR
jgi:hypothetical protein